MDANPDPGISLTFSVHVFMCWTNCYANPIYYNCKLITGVDGQGNEVTIMTGTF